MAKNLQYLAQVTQSPRVGEAVDRKALPISGSGTTGELEGEEAL